MCFSKLFAVKTQLKTKIISILIHFSRFLDIKILRKKEPRLAWLLPLRRGDLRGVSLRLLNLLSFLPAFKTILCLPFFERMQKKVRNKVFKRKDVL